MGQSEKILALFDCSGRRVLVSHPDDHAAPVVDIVQPSPLGFARAHAQRGVLRVFQAIRLGVCAGFQAKPQPQQEESRKRVSSASSDAQTEGKAVGEGQGGDAEGQCHQQGSVQENRLSRVAEPSDQAQAEIDQPEHQWVCFGRKRRICLPGQDNRSRPSFEQQPPK